jgi:iron(III) transport system substrate-binding protein
LCRRPPLLHPTSERSYLEYFMSAEGQTILASEATYRSRQSGRVGREHGANALQAAIGAQLRPVPVSPGLMVYLDQVKRNAADQALERYAAQDQ